MSSRLTSMASYHGSIEPASPGTQTQHTTLAVLWAGVLTLSSGGHTEHRDRQPVHLSPIALQLRTLCVLAMCWHAVGGSREAQRHPVRPPAAVNPLCFGVGMREREARRPVGCPSAADLPSPRWPRVGIVLVSSCPAEGRIGRDSPGVP